MVVSFQDPQINSYGILNDRNNMTEPLNMEEYHANFYIFFATPML